MKKLLLLSVGSSPVKLLNFTWQPIGSTEKAGIGLVESA
jgi:hypothetical protein